MAGGAAGSAGPRCSSVLRLGLGAATVGDPTRLHEALVGLRSDRVGGRLGAPLGRLVGNQPDADVASGVGGVDRTTEVCAVFRHGAVLPVSVADASPKAHEQAGTAS